MLFFRQPYTKNEELINALQQQNVLVSKPIINAFKAIDRQNFVPTVLEDQAYGDYPLEIGEGQTISQPTTVANMLEMLEPKPKQKILDVGSGSGWLSALLGYIVGHGGEVHGTEVRRDLSIIGRSNVDRTGLTNTRIHYTPNVLGWPKAGPYDRIVVSAATSDIPEELLKQLRAPGIMVVPIMDSLVKVSQDKHGNISQQKWYGYAFVPLVRTA